MLLAIDIGNSNIKLGLFDNRTWICTKRVPTPTMQKSEVAAQVVQSFFSEVHIEPADVNLAGIASVVPTLTEHTASAIEALCSITPVIVTNTVELPVKIDIQNPERVGSDRIANAAGGFARYGGPVIVVDTGTATKFDVVTKDGVFIGGVIATGAVTSLQALVDNAAQLFDVSFEKPQTVIGKNTTEAMQSGAFFGAVGKIDYIVERILGELNLTAASCTIVGTGGLIEIVAPESKYLRTIHPELTLEGIALIVQKNGG